MWNTTWSTWTGWSLLRRISGEIGWELARGRVTIDSRLGVPANTCAGHFKGHRLFRGSRHEISIMISYRLSNITTWVSWGRTIRKWRLLECIRRAYVNTQKVCIGASNRWCHFQVMSTWSETEGIWPVRMHTSSDSSCTILWAFKGYSKGIDFCSVQDVCKVRGHSVVDLYRHGPLYKPYFKPMQSIMKNEYILGNRVHLLCFDFMCPWFVWHKEIAGCPLWNLPSALLKQVWFYAASSHLSL